LKCTLQPTSIKTSLYGEYGQSIHVLDEILQIKKKFPQSRMTKIQLSWLHLPVTFPSWNTLEVHSIEYHKRYSLRQFGMASRSSINSTMLEDYERNPKPLQATILISGCNNLQTAFSIYNTIIKHGSPTLGVFKSLIETCLELGQPKRAIDVWKDMEKHSIILDYYCLDC